MKVAKWNGGKWHYVISEPKRWTQCGLRYPVGTEIKYAHWAKDFPDRCFRCFE